MRIPVVSSALALGLALLAVPYPALAQAGLQVDAGDKLRDVLSRQQGKSVKLRLAGGEELEGKVALVGKDVVHLSGLAGREFFDAVVDLDRVQAVIARAR